MSSTLITGGMGFIGSHLAHRLTSYGHRVLAYGLVQNYAYPGPTFLENMAYRRELLSAATTKRGSTLEPFLLTETIRHFAPTHIVHLAALPLASASLIHREEAFDNTLRGLFNVLEIIRDMSWSHIHLIYASSSMVYGDFTKTPMPEDGPTNPLGMYGALKLMGEILVKTYGLRYSIPYTIVRPSAVYGPGDTNYRVLQIFVENAVRGDPIKINGNPSLDFTYVEDVAQGFHKVITSQQSTGKTFNITRGEGRTLRGAVTILRQHFPELEIEQGDEPPHTPKRGALDVTLARDILDYSPAFSLEEGLHRYVSYARDTKGGC